MNIFITLDYELFFGQKSGTVEDCILNPTEALLKIVEPYNVKFSCFVDAGYLMALERQMQEYPKLKEDHEKVSQQIKSLAANGHGIELHVHPHWEDSFFDGSNWEMNTERYKLSDFSEKEVSELVTRYCITLEKASGKPPMAYRAGGWCAQPFGPIQKALLKNNIRIDSTVYPGGYYHSENQHFDFRGVPQYNTDYRFLEDLITENPDGPMREIPISSMKLNPIFFWKFAWKKVRKSGQHISFGNGNAVAMPKKELIRLLTRPSYSVASVDGYKASLMRKVFKKYVRNTPPVGNFVLIGHPKAFSPYSLSKLEEFIEETVRNHQYKTYQDL